MASIVETPKDAPIELEVDFEGNFCYLRRQTKVGLWVAMGE